VIDYDKYDVAIGLEFETVSISIWIVIMDTSLCCITDLRIVAPEFCLTLLEYFYRHCCALVIMDGNE
jgi:hypothetical protein